MPTTQPTLLLVSDLWGLAEADWLNLYVPALAAHYRVVPLDTRELAGIDVTIRDQDILHQQFVAGGIERAVRCLLRDVQTQVDVLGCSVGGVIGWRAALAGLPVGKLITVSATRLRHETERPNCALHLHFGTDDPYRPGAAWSDSMKVPFTLHEGGHHIYQQETVTKQVITQLIDLLRRSRI